MSEGQGAPIGGVMPSGMPQAPQRPQPTANQPDYAGYPDLDALKEGYRQSGTEAKRLKTQVDQLAQLVQYYTNAYGTNPTPQGGQPAGRPEDRLRDWGIPVDELQTFVDSRVKQTLQPLSEGWRARNRLLASHPDYAQHEQPFMGWLESDPDVSASYQRLSQADPAAALEWAYLRYGKSQPAKPAPPTPPNGAGEAALPQGRAGESRRRPEGDDLRERAWEHFQQTGNPEAYANARLSQVIPDEFLNQ